MKNLKLIVIFSCLSLSAFAQFGLTSAQQDSIYKRTSYDYNNMIQQIGIERSQIRGGASGNPKDQNAANSSEDKVNHYILPDALVLKNEKKLNSQSLD